jgi:hypothetical protein
MKRIARHDAEMPLEAAQRAFRLGIAVLVTDPRRRDLKRRSPRRLCRSEFAGHDEIEAAKLPRMQTEADPVLAAANSDKLIARQRPERSKLWCHEVD